MDLLNELLSILGALGKARIDYAVCGGIALGLHGHPRLTKDIDLLVRKSSIPKIKKALAPLGYILESAPMTFGAKTSRETRVQRISKMIGDELLMVDLIQVEPGLGEVWKNREKFELRGQPVKAVSREGLAAMKRRAGRTQDAADLEKLGGKE